MVNLGDRAIPYMNELKKRAARELGLGYLTHEEFEKFCKCQAEMERIVSTSEKRRKEAEESNEN